MKIIDEDVDLEDFEAWDGGRDRLDELIKIGTVDKAQAEIEELFPDGITDTQLNDWLWFDVEEQHPEWFNDDWDEMQEVIHRIDEMRASGKPWFESSDGAEVFLSYDTDDDDARVFKLEADMAGGNAGTYTQAEVDYDFSKDLEENMSELKTRLMVEDQVYEKLPDGMEYVEDFPEWALSLFANDDYSGYSREDVYDAESWQYENGYGDFVTAYEETRNDFSRYPAFGKACSTELAVFHSSRDAVYLIVDDRTDKYVFEDYDQETEYYGAPLLHFYSEDEARKFVDGLDGEWKEHLHYHQANEEMEESNEKSEGEKGAPDPHAPVP
jgi:hypothetical protein